MTTTHHKKPNTTRLRGRRPLVLPSLSEEEIIQRAIKQLRTISNYRLLILELLGSVGPLTSQQLDHCLSVTDRSLLAMRHDYLLDCIWHYPRLLQPELHPVIKPPFYILGPVGRRLVEHLGLPLHQDYNNLLNSKQDTFGHDMMGSLLHSQFCRFLGVYNYTIVTQDRNSCTIATPENKVLLIPDLFVHIHTPVGDPIHLTVEIHGEQRSDRPAKKISRYEDTLLGYPEECEITWSTTNPILLIIYLYPITRTSYIEYLTERKQNGVPSKLRVIAKSISALANATDKTIFQWQDLQQQKTVNLLNL